ncbi:hypothetical protein M378DRAFT_171788 [Amanita muscaria Koide BX008]|uniref:Secreted protein n=1 Tax=Amanita muscaria (strain Koide BX008) TaxID=946122 RepID=A0A0C2W8B5_AMAMK|nr:hypothetical protein M378DRAFT_171788 [Amanita muscaria Koide BX008]
MGSQQCRVMVKVLPLIILNCVPQPARPCPRNNVVSAATSGSSCPVLGQVVPHQTPLPLHILQFAVAISLLAYESSNSASLGVTGAAFVIVADDGGATASRSCGSCA